MSREERIARGERAQRILEEQIVVDALDTLERQYIAAWRSAKTVEAREDCHRYIKVLEKFKAHFGQAMGDGAMARRELSEISGKRFSL